ncbi:DUF6655 family protein [Dongia deserti]|uniref:DUF6655 family protein n=1 Tax=Dongia deserti TaxID=2268030 RepID=UPI000E64939B|nr:DUF6655 family protein [Dongia deserti]
MHRPSAGLPAFAALILAMLALGACTTVRESSPQRTATEQLLISTAVDRAVERMKFEIPTGTKVFVDAEQLEGSDGKYTAGAIKDRLLRGGTNLVADRGKADAVVEVRAGALSIDDKSTLVGIGSFDAPIPFAGQAFKIPEIALYRQKERLGVAKIAATGYGTADGKLIDSTGPRFGYSHENESVFLFFFSWRSTDLPQEEHTGLLDFN